MHEKKARCTHLAFLANLLRVYLAAGAGAISLASALVFALATLASAFTSAAAALLSALASTAAALVSAAATLASALTSALATLASAFTAAVVAGAVWAKALVAQMVTSRAASTFFMVCP